MKIERFLKITEIALGLGAATLALSVLFSPGCSALSRADKGAAEVQKLGQEVAEKAEQALQTGDVGPLAEPFREGDPSARAEDHRHGQPGSDGYDRAGGQGANVAGSRQVGSDGRGPSWGDLPYVPPRPLHAVEGDLRASITSVGRGHEDERGGATEGPGQSGASGAGGNAAGGPGDESPVQDARGPSPGEGRAARAWLIVLAGAVFLYAFIVWGRVHLAKNLTSPKS